MFEGAAVICVDFGRQDVGYKVCVGAIFDLVLWFVIDSESLTTKWKRK